MAISGNCLAANLTVLQSAKFFFYDDIQFFRFIIIFNCSFLSYLTFSLLFSFVIVLVLKFSCRR